MSKRRTLAFIALAMIAVMALFLVAACGDEEESTGGDEGGTTTELTGSAAERAEQILGHAPTGMAADIVASGTVRIANDPNYPPQSFIDEDTGDLAGFDVDAATGMAEILGLGIEWTAPKWETIPAQLQAGKFDVSIGSMTITPERQEILDFTTPYYYTSGQVFVKTGGTQITGPSDLDGKSVGVGAATTYYEFLKANTKADVKTYDTDADTFPDLANGNIEFVMTAGPTGQQAILDGKPFEFSGKPLYYEDLAFAIKKGEADWLALLDYAVNDMHESGYLTEMSMKWYNGIDLSVKE